MSSLKKSRIPSATDEAQDGFGIVDGTFKWNEAGGKDKASDKGKTPPKSNANGQESGDSTAENAEASAEIPSQEGESDAERRFELKDVTVKFPEGKLSLVTGPTASGKTALLVRLPSAHAACTL